MGSPAADPETRRHGKLSKRDGDRLGFPVFAMNWTDPKTGETATGFRETGFLPQAFVNLLAMLGWNDGTNQELFTIEELIESFSMDRVHKGRSKIRLRKSQMVQPRMDQNGCPPAPIARWSDLISSENPATEIVEAKLAEPDKNQFEKVLDLVKERCTLLPDFRHPGRFLLPRPPPPSTSTAIRPKWTEAKQLFFVEFIRQLQLERGWDAALTRRPDSRKWPLPRLSSRANCSPTADYAGRRQIRTPCLRYRRPAGPRRDHPPHPACPVVAETLAALPYRPQRHILHIT
jgi:hypothetical protein